MLIKLLKEDIRTEEIVCRKYSQTIAESDVIVPDVKPDIKRVLDVSGNVYITQKSIQPDRVFIQGKVKMTVLYAPDGEVIGKIKSLSVTQEFNHTIDCRGASPDMLLFAEAEGENYEAILVNSRKLNLRCTIGIDVKISTPAIVPLTIGIEDNPHIATNTKRLCLCKNTEAITSQIVLREQLNIPSANLPIGEILNVSATPVPIELCMMENKAIAKGEVNVSLLYNDDLDGNTIQFTEHTIPFTEILDIRGSAEGMEGEIEYSIGDMYYEIGQDSDGEARLLSIEIILLATAKGIENIEIDAVTDAYSLDSVIDLSTKSYNLEQFVDKKTAEHTHKTEAKIPPMLPKLDRICTINPDIKINRVGIDGNTITVYGTIHTNILYFTKDEEVPISGFNHISEFTQEFNCADIAPDTVCDAKANIAHTSFTLSGNESIDLRYVTGISLKIFKNGETTIIDDITETDGCIPLHPAITLYFVKHGDTLWNIAKRFCTTVESIMDINNLDSDLIYPGQRLRIISGNKGVA